MPYYEVYFFKDASLPIPDRAHPDVDKISYIEYNGDDNGMKVGDTKEDEYFALKIAGRYWEEMMSKLYSDSYEETAEDKIFQVLNKGILDKALSDTSPYTKILVKKAG